MRTLWLDEYVQSYEGFFSYPRNLANPDVPVLGTNVCNLIPPVDMAFIDADHETTAVLQDFMLLRPRLANRATLVFHDVKTWCSVRQFFDVLFADNVWNQQMKYFEFRPSGFDGLGVVKLCKDA